MGVAVFEHAARIRDPEQFDRFRRESAIFRFGDSAEGIELVMGIQIGAGEDNQDIELVQSVRAYSEVWPIDAFRKWLEDHDFEAMLIAEAIESPDTIAFADVTHSIKGAELFKVGDYGVKGEYTLHDLEEMVRCYAETGFAPALKAGHVSEEDHEELLKNSSLPALGWVENLRIDHSQAKPVLLGDFCSMPKPVYDAVKSRSYDKVSSEVLKNFDGTPFTFADKEYAAILYAVSLLGHVPPEIKDLKPLHLAQFTDYDLASLGGTWSRPVNFAANLQTTSKGSENESMDPKEALKKAEKELEELRNQLKQRDDELKKFADEGVNDAEKVAELRATLDQQAKDFEDMKKQFAESQATRISDLISQKVAAVKIPSLRKFATALYGVAYRDSTKPVTFAAGEGEPKDTALVEVLDSMFAQLAPEASLFAELAHGDGSREEGSDDARHVVQERAQAYQKEQAEKGKAITFADASKHVLDEDPSLKAAYTGRGHFTNKGAAAKSGPSFDRVIEQG